MKKYSMKLASLALFFATGAVIGMERLPQLIVQNEAWSYGLGGGYYDLKVSINDSPQEILVKGGKAGFLGHLNNINQIKIRRSGWGSSYIPSDLSVSTITSQQLDVIKQEANDPINFDKDVVLIIGATTTGFAMLSHLWGKMKFVKDEPIMIDKNNPWSLFPTAEKAKEALNVSNFNISGKLNQLDKTQQQNLITVAKLVLGFNANDKPDKSAIKKNFYKLSLQIHPDKTQDLTVSMIIDKFADQAYAIAVRAHEILMEAIDMKLI